MTISGFSTADIRALLDPLNAPNIKQYFIVDGDGDPTNIYYAQAAASGGELCLEEVLTYQVVSGNKSIEKRAWQSNQWDVSWDI